MSSEKVLRSFYDLRECKHYRAWSDEDEAKIRSLKEDLNGDVGIVSKVDDVRIISQIILDWIDHIKGPIISRHTIDFLQMIIEQIKNKSTTQTTDGKIKKVSTYDRIDKCESQ